MSPFVNVLWPSGAASEYPVVEATSSGGSSTVSNTHEVTLPSGITSGEILIVSIRITSSASTITTPTGWTSEASTTFGNGVHYVFWKTAGASEPSTVTFSLNDTDERRTVWIAYRISNAADVEASITDGTLDASSLSPSWGSSKTLWIAVVSCRRTDNSFAGGQPTGYSDQVEVDNGGDPLDTLYGRMSTATKEAEAASENPGAWTHSGDVNRPAAGLIAVQVAP